MDLRSLLAAHTDARDLIDIGAYVAGSNPVVDRAIALKPQIDGFLRQTVDDPTDAVEGAERLARLLGTGGGWS